MPQSPNLRDTVVFICVNKATEKVPGNIRIRIGKISQAENNEQLFQDLIIKGLIFLLFNLLCKLLQKKEYRIFYSVYLQVQVKKIMVEYSSPITNK